MLTKDQALRMYASNWWSGMSAREIAMFQLHERLLCMPFDRFHCAVNEALGRPVYVHEFGLNPEGLRAELLGDGPKPSMDEIMSLIPVGKRLLLETE